MGREEGAVEAPSERATAKEWPLDTAKEHDRLEHVHFNREQSEALVKLVVGIHDRVMTDVVSETDLQQQMQRQSDVFQRQLQQQTETLKELLQSHFDVYREQLHAIATDVKMLDERTNDLVREIGTIKDGVKSMRNLGFAQTALVISIIGGLATFFGGVFG